MVLVSSVAEVEESEMVSQEFGTSVAFVSTANEKHRYGVRYEFISDLISEKVSHLTFPPNSDMRSDMNPIGPHIGMVFRHNHCPYRRDIGNASSKLDSKWEK